MASHLTRDEVAHIADLARLDLSPSELDTFAPQLADILAYAATVQQADTTGVETDRTAALAEASADKPDLPPSPGLRPSRHPGTSLRSDSPAPSLARDGVLAEAPDGVGESGLFRVPKVF